MGTKHKGMHIDRANEIAVAGKAAGVACPGSASGFVTMPTSGTPATGSSFGAGEARDASLFGFVGEVVNILAVLPAGHALVVMASSVPAAHAVRIADEQGSDLVFNTEVNHGPGRFMAHIPNAPLGTLTYLALRALQLLPTARVLLAPALFFGEVPQLFAALPFERADAAPGHEQGGACVRGDGSQVNFSQVYGRDGRAWGMFGLLHLDADVQGVTPVPDQRTRASMFRKSDGQDEGGSPSAHRQDHTPRLLVYRLCGPLDRVEAFDAPGVLHAQFGMLAAYLAGGLDVGEEGMGDLLDGLGIEGELPFRRLFQLTATGPAGMGHTRILVQFHAQVPDPRRFHLRLFETLEEHRSKVIELIHANCVHMFVFFSSTRKAVMRSVSGETREAGSLSPRPLNGTGAPAAYIDEETDPKCQKRTSHLARSGTKKADMTYFLTHALNALDQPRPKQSKYGSKYKE